MNPATFHNSPVQILGIRTLLIAWLMIALCWHGRTWAEEAAEVKFTSAPATAAQGRYRLVIDQARKQMVVELQAAMKESMQAGQLDEANRISKIVASQGDDAAEPLTSAHGKAALARFKSASDRARQEYVVALKAALAQNLRAEQLEESNRISTEVKRLGDATAKEPGTAGFINLLAKIDPAKDTVQGKWTMEKDVLMSSGEGEERLEIPYQPPEEYDFRVTFTKTGTNCVVQILSETGIPFIWAMDANGLYTFRYLRGTGTGNNKTSVRKPTGLKDKHRYTSVVRVRKDGVDATLDGVVMTKWKTDYTDIVPEGWWALRDAHFLGVGTGESKTQFSAIEVKEISGPGKFTR